MSEIDRRPIHFLSVRKTMERDLLTAEVAGETRVAEQIRGRLLEDTEYRLKTGKPCRDMFGGKDE